MDDVLTPEELVVLPRMRADIEAKRYDMYRSEDVAQLLDIIDRLDKAYRAAIAGPRDYAGLYLSGGDEPSFDQIDGYLSAHFNARAVHRDG